MALDPLSPFISLGAAGLKGILGVIQGISGANQQKRLWNSRPTLGVTEGERANDRLYNQLANSTQLPGQNYAEQRLDQAYSEGVGNAQQTAISSLGATQSAVDLASKRMNAVTDLASAFAEYKNQRQEMLGQWNNKKSENELQRWDYNVNQPWQIKMNEAVSRKKEGFNAFGDALDSGLGILGDLAGTKMYTDMLQKIGSK